MTTVTELKKLFIELGGNPEDLKGCQTDADVIKLLSEVVGSTIELPAVSSTDNGKVLKVIEGAWGKGTDEALPSVSASDAGKVLFVNGVGVWAKTDYITRETKTATLSQDSNKLEFDLGSASENGVIVGFFIKDSNTKTLLNGKTVSGACEITVSGTGNNTSKLVLTPSSGTFSAGTYKVEVYVRYDNSLMN